MVPTGVVMEDIEGGCTLRGRHRGCWLGRQDSVSYPRLSKAFRKPNHLDWLLL